MTLLAILSYISSIVGFLGVVVVIGRGIFKQASAVQENTEAVQKLTVEVTALKNDLYKHESRLAVLEDRDRRMRR